MITRTRTARWVVAPAGIAVAAVALSACAGDADSSPTPAADVAQEVVFAIKEDAGCIDPQQTSVTTALNVGRQLTDSLLDQDPETGEIVPWLAESWEVSDDLTSYTFTLRDDVTFSDDTALTSDVVAANFDAIIELGGSASLDGAYLEGYTGTEVVSDTEFIVSFDTPNVAFLQGATTMSLGILSEA